MKKLLPVFATLLLAGILNDCYAQQGLPYKAGSSSDFKIGNSAYSKIVLELWKDWDDNTFDKHDYFADTVIMYLPDSMVVKGKAENIAGAKKYRAGMTSAKSVVHAWVPLHSNDKKDDAVCIWGTETDTWPDGRVEIRDLHEVWWFNKDGKVTAMRQWAAKFGQ
ncbi:hypothetical protein BH10BAC3_BH10BAC3_14820 [soil metagenome]